MHMDRAELLAVARGDRLGSRLDDPFARRGRLHRALEGWGKPGKAKREDVLEMTATNLRRITVHPERAGLTCFANLTVTTDGPLTVKFAGCGRSDLFE